MSAESRAGAFFDIDGTLLPWPSLEWRFIGYLASRDILGPAAAARSIGIAFENLAAGAPLATGNRIYLAGLSTSLADDWLADLSQPLPILADGLRRLEWHASQGHRIALISGTLAPLARAFAERIGLELEIHATELETVSDATGERRGFAVNLWTGRLASDWPNGQTKAHIVRRIAAEHHLDLARSFAYGDSASDAAMLASAGFPRAVNPSLCLRRVAADRRWIIEYWKSRATPRPANIARYASVARIGGQR
jgi:HAD superfamily phosphoserine phosphatase-like hydrolase